MVTEKPLIKYSDMFCNDYKKKDKTIQIKIKKQIHRIIQNSSRTKPMRNNRKGTCEVRIKPF